MLSSVCFARLHASMTWDVLDMSRDFWVAGVKGLLQARTDLLLMSPVRKHSYRNTYDSDRTPFEQRWKLSFNYIASLQRLVPCQSVEIQWWNYKEISCSNILGFSGGGRAEHVTTVVASEGLSLLLTSPARKAEVALVIEKRGRRSRVPRCVESVQSDC